MREAACGAAMLPAVARRAARRYDRCVTDQRHFADTEFGEVVAVAVFRALAALRLKGEHAGYHAGALALAVQDAVGAVQEEKDYPDAVRNAITDYVATMRATDNAKPTIVKAILTCVGQATSALAQSSKTTGAAVPKMPMH